MQSKKWLLAQPAAWVWRLKAKGHDMTLYAGQTRTDVVRFENEEGKTLFDEKTRKEATEVLKTKELSPDLHEKLVRMYRDGSYQAQYFLGRYIIEDIIEYPTNPEDLVAQTISTPVVTEDNIARIDASIDGLRASGVEDPYAAIENE